MRRWNVAAVGVVVAIVLGVMATFAPGARAETLSWSAPTTYTDNTAIPTADRARITYTLYYGSSSTGPWTLIGTSAAGATSYPVTVAAPGVTRYFTGEATLDGMTSAKAVPYAYTTPFKVPGAPSGMSVQ